MSYRTDSSRGKESGIAAGTTGGVGPDALGDPAGIGPEIIVKALAARPGLPVLVYGDPAVLAATSAALGLPPVPPERVRAVVAAEDGAGILPAGAREGGEAIVTGRPNLAS